MDRLRCRRARRRGLARATESKGGKREVRCPLERRTVAPSNSSELSWKSADLLDPLLLAQRQRFGASHRWRLGREISARAEDCLALVTPGDHMVSAPGNSNPQRASHQPMLPFCTFTR